jgi:hypothetical protein
MEKLSPEDLALVLEALRTEASRRQRAATAAAGELEEDVRAERVSDRRPASVKIVKLLQEANVLRRVADKLESENVEGGAAVVELPSARAEKQASPRSVLAAEDEVEDALEASEPGE